MSAGDVIEQAVLTLTDQVRDAYAAGEKQVTVDAYLLMALLAGYGSLMLANGLLAQREREPSAG